MTRQVRRRIRCFAAVFAALLTVACARGDAPPRDASDAAAPGASSAESVGASVRDSARAARAGSSRAGSAAAPASAATHPARLPAAALPPARDTVRGVLRRIGADPLAQWVLTPAAGAAVIVEGPLVSSLEALDGLEVVVGGTLSSTARAGAGATPLRVFVGERYLVRAAEGRAALDGTVVRQGDVFALRLADGRTIATPFLPPALRASIGARVWIAGPLDRDPAGYGVLRR